MHRLGQIVAGLVFLLAFLGGLALIVRLSQPGGVEVVLPTPTPQETVRVYITGAVARPGVYTLREGDRLAEALEAAGGPTSRADLAAVNLARPLEDGAHYHIPARGETAALIDLNSADLAQLMSIRGIGEALARAIIRYRQEHGPFLSVEDLLKVPGIGPATLEKVRPYVTVR